MKAKYFTTPNGLNLLTEWGGENRAPETYAANEARARAAVYRFIEDERITREAIEKRKRGARA